MKPAVACDIELYRNYLLVGLKRISDGTLLQFEMSDRSELEKERLKRVLLNHRIITFNGLTYDLPLIYYALDGATNEQLKRASDRIIQGNVKYWDVEDLLGIRIPRDVDHIDLIEPQPNAFAALKLLAGRLHSKTLQDLPFEHDTVLTHEQMDIVTAYNGHDLDDTIDLFHALKDRLELREALGKQYLGENNQRGFMSKSDAQIGEAIIKREVEKATGQKVQKERLRPGETFPYRAPEWLKFEHPELVEVMARLADTEFVVKSNGKVDLPPFLKERKVRIGETEYAMGIGGLHSTEKERAVVADDDHVLIDFDVASYYPAIIIGSGLYPKALGRAFIEVFDRIRLQRVAAKNRASEIKEVDLPNLRSWPTDTDEQRRAAKSRYKELDEEAATCTAIAEGLKIALNGCFGKLGSPYSILYAPHLMIAVTLTGQLALLMLIDRAESAGIKVVSANTDGVVFHCPRDESALPIKKSRLASDGLLREIIEQWERDTGFTLEATEYSGLYSQSVNSYIAVKTDGKAKRKGPLSNPLKETPPDLRTQMMTSPSMNVCADAVVAWLTEGAPIEQTIRERDDIRDFVTVVKVDGGATWRGKYLGKYVRFIWSTDGDPIFYKKAHPTTGNHKTVSKSEGSRPVMVLPQELPIDIDYEHYIAEARELLFKIGANRRPPPPLRVKVYAADRYNWLALAIAA